MTIRLQRDSLSSVDLAIRRTDLVLPCLFGAVGTAEILVQGYRPLGTAIGTFWLGSLVLCARRRFPLLMPPLVFGVYALTPLIGFDVSQPASWLLLVMLACLAAGLHVPRAQARLGLASVAGACALGVAALAAFTDFNPDILFGLVITIGPWALGVGMREMLERNRNLATEAERTRLEQAVAVDRAAVAERERIARELHDVLAHSLSVMVVQASLAEDLLRRDPEAATGAIREVQQSGRAALGETGRLLRLIRDDGNELGMQPQHLVSDIPALVDEYARAGLAVDLQLVSDSCELQAGVGLSAYRIVQEALTNALRHAPGSRVTVRLSRQAAELLIEVHNGPAAAEPVTSTGGHGLIGIRERVSLFGGTLSAAPTGDGGFRLAATLPAQLEAT
jgi:signal transduction histidine kinase